MSQNKYLEKIALNRLVSELAKGNVSTGVEKLVSKGFIRPAATYNKGMALGNKNIAKQIGMKVHTPRTALDRISSNAGGGYASVIRKNGEVHALHVKPSQSMFGQDSHHGLIRHELFEGHDIKRVLNNPKRVSEIKPEHYAEVKAFMGDDYNHKHVTNRRIIKPDVFTNNGQITGMHVTPRVLTRESEMVRKNPHLGEFKDLRNMTGEDRIVHKITGKRYGMDKMTTRDHAKAFASSNKVSPHPEKQLADMTHGHHEVPNLD
jgi:hypothetical protein